MYKKTKLYIDTSIWNLALEISRSEYKLTCDFIVSWNFKHIVRAKTIKGVHVINLREGYSLIEIASPREFISE